MPPFNIHGNSSNNNMNGFNNDDDDDDGSIGSNTFREIRRKAYEEEGETDEQLFNQHNTIQSLFDNRHHDVNFDDDLNSAGSSLGGYSDLGAADNASKIGGETREDMRMSLIARRRRLAQMENAMAEEGSVDFSLRLNKDRIRGRGGKGGLDASSLVSSLRDSIISLGDSAQFSSRKSSKKKKKSKDKKKKKSSKSKSSSKDRERERRKEKEREKKRKLKEKEKKKKKSKRRDYSSDETSSESESSQSSSDRRRRRSEKDGRHRGDRDRDKPSEKVRVPFEVDKRTGKCTYHSDVRLKRKSSDGRWKPVLKECPKCKADAIKRSKAKSSRRRKGGGSDSESSSASASEPKKKSSSSRRGSERVPQKSSSSRHRTGESSRGAPPSRQTSRGSSHAPSSSRRPGESSRGSKPPPKTSSSRHRSDPREFAESAATKKTLETHGTMRTFETGATRSTLKTGNHSERSERRPSSKPSRSNRELRRTSSREIGAVDFDPPTKQRSSNGGTKHKSSGGGQFDESYQESDFALFQGNGGKQYNEEGMFGFFKEKISNQQIKSSTMIDNEDADKVVIRDTVPKKEDSSSYDLGDEGKRRDMIKDDDKSAAVKRIASLQSGDSAFIRRTTGNWTFAKVKNVSPDSILFIVDEKGASKDYKKKYWGSHVRAAVAGVFHSGDSGRGGKSSGGGATRFSVLNLHDD